MGMVTVYPIQPVLVTAQYTPEPIEDAMIRNKNAMSFFLSELEVWPGMATMEFSSVMITVAVTGVPVVLFITASSGGARWVLPI
ncbi:hypothetical protein V2J09_018679 [Rumex salicifolius]